MIDEGETALGGRFPVKYSGARSRKAILLVLLEYRIFRRLALIKGGGEASSCLGLIWFNSRNWFGSARGIRILEKVWS